MKKRGCLKTIVVAVAVMAVLAVVATVYLRWKYPYGNRHLCNKGIGLALKMYAADHEGRLPSGMPTPEASLGLLYPKYVWQADTLGGKTTPSGVAESLLANGKPLTPEACSWHYVEGLSESDPPNLAVLWDKVPGYGHNCERMRDTKGREVLFLDGHSEWFPGDEWDNLMSRQAELMRKRSEKRSDDLPPR